MAFPPPILKCLFAAASLQPASLRPWRPRRPWRPQCPCAASLCGVPGVPTSLASPASLASLASPASRAPGAHIIQRFTRKAGKLDVVFAAVASYGSIWRGYERLETREAQHSGSGRHRAESAFRPCCDSDCSLVAVSPKFEALARRSRVLQSFLLDPKSGNPQDPKP